MNIQQGAVAEGRVVVQHEPAPVSPRSLYGCSQDDPWLRFVRYSRPRNRPRKGSSVPRGVAVVLVVATPPPARAPPSDLFEGGPARRRLPHEQLGMIWSSASCANGEKIDQILTGVAQKCIPSVCADAVRLMLPVLHACQRPTASPNGGGRELDAIEGTQLRARIRLIFA